MSNIWQEAVTDRSQEDVNRALFLLSKVKFSEMTAEEQAEFLEDNKGCLNRSDLLRIKNNVELMLEVLELDNAVSDVPELPQTQYYDELLTNVTAIRTAGPKKGTTPEVPVAPLNTYQKWNDIEQILFDVYDLLLNNFHYYCGREIFSGDSVGWLI